MLVLLSHYTEVKTNQFKDKASKTFALNLQIKKTSNFFYY